MKDRHAKMRCQNRCATFPEGKMCRFLRPEALGKWLRARLALPRFTFYEKMSHCWHRRSTGCLKTNPQKDTPYDFSGLADFNSIVNNALSEPPGW